MNLPRAALFATLALLAGCGGDDKPDPKPMTYDRVAAQVHRLADEMRWGCRNVPAIMQQADRVARDADRLGDPRASRLAEQAVGEAQGVVAGCP